MFKKIYLISTGNGLAREKRRLLITCLLFFTVSDDSFQLDLFLHTQLKHRAFFFSSQIDQSPNAPNAFIILR